LIVFDNSDCLVAAGFNAFTFIYDIRIILNVPFDSAKRLILQGRLLLPAGTTV
jgi:hypothetical protein